MRVQSELTPSILLLRLLLLCNAGRGIGRTVEEMLEMGVAHRGG